ncbi:MAG: hypothetical protein HOE90_00725 [Bacteriovoracaceae bacterium]|mgnify:FL=1|nr:hypothetical protein [Bacteriovoracaceae bacterium]
MNLQEKTIFDFRQVYPDLTLKEVSSITGLQVTRVFRLFRGAEMKLREYEALSEATTKKGENQNSVESKFKKISSQCWKSLPCQTLEELTEELKDLLKIENLKTP